MNPASLTAERIIMNYMFRLGFLVISLSLAAACGAFGAQLTTLQKSQVEQPALNVGKLMLEQKHSQADTAKVVATMVANTYAQTVNPNQPEAPVSADGKKEIDEITADVLKQLGISGNPGPVNPTPAPAPTPAPTPAPQPDNPPSPKPGNSGQNNVVWVFVPVNPQASVPPVVNYYPRPGVNQNQAPTIIIHRGWHGNPPTVRYRYR